MWVKIFRFVYQQLHQPRGHGATNFGKDTRIIYMWYALQRHYSSSMDHEEEKRKDEEDKNIAADLAVMTNDQPLVTLPLPLKTECVLPGKGAPPEPPVTCCMSGCVNCVWISYAEELKEYYKDGGEQARKALEQIEDPSLKAFIKLELDL